MSNKLHVIILSFTDIKSPKHESHEGVIRPTLSMEIKAEHMPEV